MELHEMSPAEYGRLTSWLRARPVALRALLFFYRALPVCYLVTFPLLPALLWRAEREAGALFPWARPLGALAVCLFVLVLGSVLQHCLNLPRPYERPGCAPLVAKKTAGHSFPSRHGLSAGVIAMAWWYYNPWCGAGMLLLAVALCATRVLAGVHYLRDVLAGLGLGVFLGWLGLFAVL